MIFPRISSVTFADITFRSGRKRKRKRKFNSKLISLSKNVHRKRVYFGWKKKSEIYRKVSIQLSCVHLGGKNWEKRIENSHSIFLCVSLERARFTSQDNRTRATKRETIFQKSIIFHVSKRSSHVSRRLFRKQDTKRIYILLEPAPSTFFNSLSLSFFLVF